MSEYKSPNGLGLVRFEPNYSGDALQTAGEEPEIGDKCKLLGWDIDVSFFHNELDIRLNEYCFNIFPFPFRRTKENHIN